MKRVTIQPLFKYSILFNAVLSPAKDINSNLFMSGRYALERSLLELIKKHKQFEKIYIPNLICEEVVTIIENTGIKIEYYDINHRLQIDTKMLEESITDKLSVILIVNYFGFPSQWGRINEMRKRKQCIIIEDNTHSLYSSLNKKKLGCYGDISFNSFRKILPLLSGSELISNTKDIVFKNTHESRGLNISEIMYSLRGFKNLFMKKSSRKKNINKNKYLPPEPIDIFSKRILGNYKFDKNKIKMIRVKNYHFWYNYLRNQDLKFFDDLKLNENICPYVFPCYADNNEIVNKWIKWGNEHNINIITWPKYHPSTIPFLNDDFKKRILCFPVNQQFDLTHIIR
tara:strand:+ start:968 stop:1993 length:1026 start_codon:yes stop_codon:yes gene_type:complete